MSPFEARQAGVQEAARRLDKCQRPEGTAGRRGGRGRGQERRKERLAVANAHVQQRHASGRTAGWRGAPTLPQHAGDSGVKRNVPARFGERCEGRRVQLAHNRR
eukprot:7965168-Pyramimonas_sp.AAC.1